jgi:hypothetical protein
MNIELCYQYRDGDNYKQWTSIVFSNPNGLSLEEIEESLRSSFDGGEYFIASQIGIPECFIKDYALNGSDHCWHEFVEVDETTALPSENRTIAEFIKEVSQVEDWVEFERGD